MQNFRITVKHDAGRTTIKTSASDEKAARSLVCAAENCPESAITKCVRVYPKLKTIDIYGKEWFDRVNGNSYFSGHIVVNHGDKDAFILEMPYQYGYGDSYAQEGMRLVRECYPKLPKYDYQVRDLGIVTRRYKQENCRKKDLKC